ncbi:MAG TPA: sugar phosphate isomerase/epimerase family protein [Terriglobales bacterium]|nr:sugar phosphate isomerase/epimerase family protein [Terriglobales bacterium]
MTQAISRRRFIAAGIGAFATVSVAPVTAGASEAQRVRLPKSPFRISVITDEISQDFGHACEVASQQFGMDWVELRGLWNKNIATLDSNDISRAVAILKKYDLRVSDIASPLFKVDWPNTPKSKTAERDQFNANFTYQQQDEVLDRSIAVAKQFSADRIRCFDFWRLDDPAPYRNAINEVLQNAAEKVGRAGLVLVLENEMSCNTGTGAEAAKTLSGVPSKHFMLNWDPGNAARLGEIPYPDGYQLLPKQRIGHCHVKDVAKTAKGYEWAAMGKGIIDWSGQFAALKRDGYHFAVSLETHWHGPGGPEASSVESWAGMKQALQKAGAL